MDPLFTYRIFLLPILMMIKCSGGEEGCVAIGIGLDNLILDGEEVSGIFTGDYIGANRDTLLFEEDIGSIDRAVECVT